ncbi:MAG: hypothetical protein IKS49_07070 [Actinomycetaceae bacterium]|nr:hypothetical protein [Actinomycetaceae bacterium]
MIEAVFVGLPASGKTTVGKILARYLDSDFADSDTLIEEATGKSIPELFEERGEEGFREVEAEVIAQALEERSGVLSLGGGAVLSAATRDALRDHRVFFIDADKKILLSRLQRSTNDRPLMRENVEENLERLSKEREPLYREVATDIVSSEFYAPQSVARKVLSLLGRAHTTVIEGAGWSALIGSDLAFEVGIAFDRASDIVLIHEGDIPASYRSHIERGHRCYDMPISADVENWHDLAQRFFHDFDEQSISSSGAIFAYGSSDVLSFAAYCAAVYGGGLPVLAVPTSLEAALCGAFTAQIPSTNFHTEPTPAEILCDLDVMTYQKADFAEALSVAFMDSNETLMQARYAASTMERRDIEVLLSQTLPVRMESAAFQHRNETFLYGHTFAGVLESLAPDMGHGQALAYGMIFAAGLAEGLTIAPFGWARKHVRAVEDIGLSTRLEGLRREDIEDEMRRQAALHAPDIKMYKVHNRFMVLSDFSNPRVVVSVSGKALGRAFHAIGL